MSLAHCPETYQATSRGPYARRPKPYIANSSRVMMIVMQHAAAGGLEQQALAGDDEACQMIVLGAADYDITAAASHRRCDAPASLQWRAALPAQPMRAHAAPALPWWRRPPRPSPAPSPARHAPPQPAALLRWRRRPSSARRRPAQAPRGARVFLAPVPRPALCVMGQHAQWI